MRQAANKECRDDNEPSGLLLSGYKKADILLLFVLFFLLELFYSKSIDHFPGQCVNLEFTVVE